MDPQQAGHFALRGRRPGDSVPAAALSDDAPVIVKTHCQAIHLDHRAALAHHADAT